MGHLQWVLHVLASACRELAWVYYPTIMTWVISSFSFPYSLRLSITAWNNSPSAEGMEHLGDSVKRMAHMWYTWATPSGVEVEGGLPA